MNRNRVTHTNTFWNDVVIGDQNAENHFVGYGEGLDILIGGNRNDTFQLTYEHDEYVDTVYGGWGVDTLDFSLADRGLSINLQEGIAGLVVYDWNYEVNGPNFDGFEPSHPERVEVSTVFNSIENVVGTAFDDRILGNDADNVIEGGGGSDLIYGGRGNDTASYANSNEGVVVSLQGLQSAVGGLSELLGFGFGGDANGDALVSIENVIGSAYNDTFYGSRADNIFDGGDGIDTFVFGRNIGHDTIRDFDATGNDHDIIRLENVFDSWHELRNNMEDTGDDVVIYIDDHNSITLENVRFNDLNASDFWLA
jgi:Ca2+-binding RTX toxin-like protein